MGFPGGAVVNNSSADTGDSGATGSVSGSGRSLGVGNGNPPQYSCLENSLDRGAWQVTIQGVTKSWTWLTTEHACKANISSILQWDEKQIGLLSKIH